MKRVVIVLLVACENPPVTPPPEPVKVVDAAVPDATPIVPVRPTIPVTLASAPAWVMRQLDVGMVTFPQRAETFTLRRDNGRALLEIAMQKAISTDLLNVSGWEAPTTRRYLGTVTEASGTITLDVADGAETIHLACKLAKQKAAGAKAMRKPGPRRGEDCGDKGHWSPATTTAVDVLRCETDEATRKYGAAPYLALAAAPGLEWVHVNDDCVMQGGGWRSMPADGSIAEFKGD